ncbi:hypothetical protein CRG98_034490 [Punica granatum]|uniref:Uncharacterized protein n=1 Tax=Punica granatum TaxID=22663 RepID=A0A2I0INX0_PUNGR|nr:hypothetical protein CRG98_034490 [Punica granatum]
MAQLKTTAQKGAEAGYSKTRSRNLGKEEIWSDRKGAELRQRGTTGLHWPHKGTATTPSRISDWREGELITRGGWGGGAVSPPQHDTQIGAEKDGPYNLRVAVDTISTSDLRRRCRWRSQPPQLRRGVGSKSTAGLSHNECWAQADK